MFTELFIVCGDIEEYLMKLKLLVIIIIIIIIKKLMIITVLVLEAKLEIPFKRKKYVKNVNQIHCHEYTN